MEETFLPLIFGRFGTEDILKDLIKDSFKN